MKKKLKKAFKVVRTLKKPFGVTLLLFEKVICRLNVEQKETGRNPFTLY